MKQTGLAGALLAVCVFTAQPASAEDDAKEAAKYHFELGVDLYKAGDHAGAMAEFLKAREASPHYAPLYNIAMCHLELQDYKDAMETFELYLEEGGTEISQDRVQEVQDRLKEIKSILCQVTLDVDVEGAEILVDGQKLGTTPLEGILFLDAGEHILRIHKEGHEPYEKEIVLSRGEKASYSIQLPALEGEEDDGQPVPAPVQPASGPDGKKTVSAPVLWAVLSTTAALLVTSAVTGGLVVSRKNHYDEMSAQADWMTYRSVTRRLAVATDVLWAVGGAGVIATIVLAVFTDFHGQSEDQAWLDLGVGGRSLHLSLVGRF